MGPGRLGKAPGSRSGSAAREILKRRDKPYKIELSRVSNRKHRLHIQMSSNRAPQGYTFLPVGTPELAERCKDLSRQQNLPIYIARPSKNPAKVSHHLGRVGYHFNTGVVRTACLELGYVSHRGHFVTKDELEVEYAHSRIAKTMAKHGFKPLLPVEPRETPSQVRTTIRELFPKMPEEDLNSIVKFAWEEGSERVGTNSDLTLARRVQLATIARIRHAYTDYDGLLRAFGDWKQARETVEPDCLRKLIEWRGEEDVGEDDGLEEIVRETIVIQDDEDEGIHYGQEADDETSSLELEDTSDASVEVVHRIAREDDLAAETTAERTRRFPRHFRPRNTQQMEDWTNVARQKIVDMRRQIRNAPPPTNLSVTVQPNERGELPRALVVDGLVYHRAPSPTRGNQTDFQTRARMPSEYTSGTGYNALLPHNYTSSAPTPSAPQYELSSDDRPISSIEPHDGFAQNLTPLSHHSTQYSIPYDQTRSPMQLGYEHPGKRRRIDRPPSADIRQPNEHRSLVSDAPKPRFHNPVDWTLLGTPPEPHLRSQYVDRPHPLNHYGDSTLSYGGSAHSIVPTPRELFDESLPKYMQQTSLSEPEPYDPRRPLIENNASYARQPMVPLDNPLYRVRPVYPEVQAVLPRQEQHIDRTYYDPHGVTSVYIDGAAPQVTYLRSDGTNQVAYPVHGAPAPVQPAVRGRGPGFSARREPYRAPSVVPLEGAPHPAQMYYPR